MMIVNKEEGSVEMRRKIIIINIVILVLLANNWSTATENDLGETTTNLVKTIYDITLRDYGAGALGIFIYEIKINLNEITIIKYVVPCTNGFISFDPFEVKKAILTNEHKKEIIEKINKINKTDPPCPVTISGNRSYIIFEENKSIKQYTYCYLTDKIEGELKPEYKKEKRNNNNLNRNLVKLNNYDKFNYKKSTAMTARLIKKLLSDVKDDDLLGPLLQAGYSVGYIPSENILKNQPILMEYLAYSTMMWNGNERDRAIGIIIKSDNSNAKKELAENIIKYENRINLCEVINEKDILKLIKELKNRKNYNKILIEKLQIIKEECEKN